MRDFSQSHAWMSINTATVRKSLGQEVPLALILDACARHGVRAVAPWRDQVAAMGLPATAVALKSHGMAVSGYVRAGLFTALNAEGLRSALDDNRRAVDEACTLNAACLIMMVGGLPGVPPGGPVKGMALPAASKNISLARSQAFDGMAATLEYARSRGMKLAIEPLHPMFAADRCAVNTLEQALDMCDALDPECTGAVGVAVDCFHTWWDPKLEAQIARAGKQRILAFHVCDWLVPTTDLLNDRGMMGDGVIDIPRMRAMVEAQGFGGYSEVEIFSTRWWQRSTDDILSTCVARHKAVV
jgi:sugar phosphate isomerase/epimerase